MKKRDNRAFYFKVTVILALSILLLALMVLPHSVVKAVETVDVQVFKSVNVVGKPSEGELIWYTILVGNSATGGSGIDATNIEVTDILPAGVTYDHYTTTQGTYNPATGKWDVGTLAQGNAATLYIYVTVNSGTAGATITNTATLTYVSESDENPLNDQGSVAITVNNADLSLTKTVDNANPNQSDNITYTVTVTNNGPDTTSGIEITDVLPAGVTYVSDNASQGSYAANIWDAGTVAASANATLQITATVDLGTAGTTITNTAEVTAADEGDAVSGNNQASVDITVPGADLSLTKTVDNANPNQSDNITYTVTVTNNGPDTTSGIEITDVLPAGVTYVSDNASQGAYISNVWDVGSLADSANAKLQITATVDLGTAGTTITNTAEVTAADQADPNPGNNQFSVDITVQGADLSVTKTVDNANPNQSDTITYTVTVSNSGPDAASGIQVTDVLPAGVTYVSDNASQGSYAANIWSVGMVAASANATLQITATVDLGTAGTTITNTAELTAVDQGDPDSTPDNNAPAEDDQDDAAIAVAIPPTPQVGGGNIMDWLQVDILGSRINTNISHSGQIQTTIDVTLADGRLSIHIPKGTVVKNAYGGAQALLNVSPNENPPPPPEGAHIIGLAYNFTPKGTTFDPPITLTFTYDPETLPEGVAEEDLVLAFYDEAAGEWVTLECTVDTENNTITASISHFTNFAVIGKVTQAKFSFSNLVVQPAEVEPGEAVTVTVWVDNIGGVEGVCCLTMRINGVDKESREVALPAEANESVSFTLSKQQPGTYLVDVSGLTGSFKVVEPAPASTTPKAPPPPAEVKSSPPLPQPSATTAPSPTPPAPAQMPTEPESATNWLLIGILSVVGVLLVTFLIYRFINRRD